MTRNRSLNPSDLSLSISETGIITSTLQGYTRTEDDTCKTLDAVPDTEEGLVVFQLPLQFGGSVIRAADDSNLVSLRFV